MVTQRCLNVTFYIHCLSLFIFRILGAWFSFTVHTILHVLFHIGLQYKHHAAHCYMHTRTCTNSFSHWHPRGFAQPVQANAGTIQQIEPGPPRSTCCPVSQQITTLDAADTAYSVRGCDMDWTTEVSSFDSRQGQVIYFFSSGVCLAPIPIKPAVQWVTDGLSVEAKQPSREADNSHPTITNIMNAWSHTTNPPTPAFMVCTGITAYLLVSY